MNVQQKISQIDKNIRAGVDPGEGLIEEGSAEQAFLDVNITESDIAQYFEKQDGLKKAVVALYVMEARENQAMGADPEECIDRSARMARALIKALGRETSPLYKVIADLVASPDDLQDLLGKL